jgi:superoxide dismutase
MERQGMTTITNLEENARRVVESIRKATGDPKAIREIIDTHRAHFEELSELARARRAQHPTSRKLDAIEKAIEDTLDALDELESKLEAWQFGTSTTIIAGITNDIGVILSIAIATILGQITK